MHFYVLKNSQQLGPFEESTVSDCLQSGEFSPNDLAWRPGIADWQPLSIILTPQSTTQLGPQASDSSPGNLQSWLKAGGMMTNVLLIAAIVLLVGSFCAYVVGTFLINLCRNISVGVPGPTCIVLIENPGMVNVSFFGFVLGIALLIGGLVGKIGRAPK
jgi:hypothetical protein